MTHVYTMPIVSNLKELETALFNEDFNGRRACINRILYHLF